MNYVSFEEENIQSFKINQTALSNSKLAGSCELGTAEIQLLNDSNEYSDFKGNWIKTIKGSFYIYDVEPVQEKINIKLSCYDIKYLLDVTYDETDYKDMFPCTLVEWRDKMAEDLGITFGDDGDFANANYTLSEHPYVDDSVSYRDVFKMQAEAGASWIETDENDVFYFAWVKSSANIVFDDWFSLTTEKTATSPVNEVVLGRGDVEDIVIWPNPAPDDAVEFRIDNNYILDPQDTTSSTDRRNEVIQKIYNRVVGMSYIPFELNTEGIDNVFDIELGSKVTYTDVWGNELESFVMSIEWEFFGGDLSVSSNWGITIKAEEISSTSTEYSYAGNTSDTITKLGLSVDKNNQTIEALAQQQTGTTEQISSIELNIDSITQTVSSLSDQSSAIASITVTLEEIQQEITALSDLTTSDMGMGSITLKDVNESALIYLQIYPTATDISYLYPSNSLYSGNDLYPLSRDLIIKSDEEEIRYTLPCNLLYYNSDVYDEFVYSYETTTCYKIKRVDIDENGDKYPLDEEEVIYYDFELINLAGGDYSIYLLSFSDGMLQARAMVSNLYTDQYVTQAQYESGLSILKDEINASVEEQITLVNGNIETLSGELDIQATEIALKLNATDFTTAAVIGLINNRDGTSTALISADNINLTAGNVISILAGNTLNLTSNNIAISSTNFSVTSAGVITATGADISGKITATSGSFTGSIYASSGTIGGMTLTSNSIYSGTSSMSSTTAGIYLGTAGFRQYSSSSAYVNIANGILTCAGATITGTISGSTISGSTISGGSITIGNYFSVTSTGLTQMSTSDGGFLSLRYTTHPYASALSLVNGENYGIYFVSGTSQSSTGSNLSHIYDSGSGALYIRSLASSGTVNINHTSSGQVAGAVGICNIVIDGTVITGGNGGSMYANSNCMLCPADTSHYAYVRTTDSSNRIAVSSSGPSSLNVKKNLVNIEDEYEDLYKDLQKINMYNFNYKYKGIKDFDSDFGFIIDELENTEHISKYIRNFECKGRIENDTLIKKANDDVKDEDLPFSYKEWERDAYIKLLFILVKSIQNKIDKLESEVANG